MHCSSTNSSMSRGASCRECSTQDVAQRPPKKAHSSQNLKLLQLR